MRTVSFEADYQQFLDLHSSTQKGESLRRLREGHGYGEKLFLQKIWWPAFKNLEYLYPEYAIMDMRYGSYFLDFAYIPHPPLLRLAIEIDGYGPHLQQLDRRQFTDQLNRQNFLIATDWKVLRFSIDEMKENASRCIQYLQLLLGRYYGIEQPLNKSSLLEKEILRLGVRLGRPFSGREAALHLQMHRNKAQALLRRLAEEHLLLPAQSGRERIHYYQINESKLNHILLSI
jgi:hypothetical protein